MTFKFMNRREALKTGAAVSAFAGVSILAAKKTLAQRAQKLVYWHLPTFAPVADETELAKLTKVVGDSGFAQADRGRDVADAELVSVERRDNSESRGIAQRCEQCREVIELVRERQRPLSRAHSIEMNHILFANWCDRVR